MTNTYGRSAKTPKYILGENTQQNVLYVSESYPDGVMYCRSGSQMIVISATGVASNSFLDYRYIRFLPTSRTVTLSND